MSTPFTREGDLSAISRIIELATDDINAVNGNYHLPLQDTVHENLGEAVEILRESNENIPSPKDYWPASSSESSVFSEDSGNKLPEPSISSEDSDNKLSEPLISCEDNDNQRLAASPLTAQDEKGVEIVLQEANSSPNIKLESKSIAHHHLPIPKLSLESINLNNRSQKSNENYTKTLISCEDSDNQRLAASPLTAQDGKGVEIVLQEASQSPNIKLESKSTPRHHTLGPKLSLESINLNNRLKESNETYANPSQPSLLFRALETSRQLHNLPKNFHPLGKFQFSAVEPEKNFSTKNCLVSNNNEE